jgi:hypothetical protein
VVRQSNNVNTLAMISAKQEREEPVRQFAARLHALAAVCNLSVTCSCGLKVSEVEKLVRMSLIGGLNDEDTKQDATITFVEARETGKTALKILGGKLASGQINKVQQEREDQRSCNYCGQKGHWKTPNIDLRKADCPAFGKKFTKCHQKGHYAGVCKSRKGDKKDDAQPDSKKTTAGTNHHQQDEDVGEVRQDIEGLTDNTELDEAAAEYEETTSRSMG